MFSARVLSLQRPLWSRTLPNALTRAAFSTSQMRMESRLSSFFESPIVSIPSPDDQVSVGRAWDCGMLRRKSWDDLQSLWYVLLRERNMLHTEKQESQRLQVSPRMVLDSRLDKVRQSMRNVKKIIAERQNAWEDALKLWQLKCKGVDIYNPETQALIEREWANLRFVERHRKDGMYLKGANGRRYRQLSKMYGPVIRADSDADRKKSFTETMTDRKAAVLDVAEDAKAALESFRVLTRPDQQGAYDLDMTPVRDRRHRTRRRVGKFRINARSDV